eukprot:g35304.t1
MVSAGRQWWVWSVRWEEQIGGRENGQVVSGQGGGDEREGWSWDEAGSGAILKLVKSTLRPLAPKGEYEVLLLQFLGGVIVTLEEAQDGPAVQGVGRGVEVVRNWKVLTFVMNKAQVLYKAVSEPLLELPDVEEATSGAADAVDNINGCAGEHLSDVEGFFGSLDGGEGRGVGA